jgi:hypothetical protein
MKKIKSVFKRIPVNPYTVELWVLITDDPYFECGRLNQKFKGLEFRWEGDAAAMTNDFYNDNYLLVVFNANSNVDVNTICHEVVHIKNRINHHAGIMHDPDNDEPEAYLSGWIAEQIETAWREYKKI